MTDDQIIELIHEQDTTMMMCDQLKARCYTIRKRLEVLLSPTSPKGSERVENAVSKVMAKRMSKISLAPGLITKSKANYGRTPE